MIKNYQYLPSLLYFFACQKDDLKESDNNSIDPRDFLTTEIDDNGNTITNNCE